MSVLSPELIRQIEQLQLLAQRRAKSSARGERRSRARGQSVEFADYRNYVPGDDLRYLDWNLFGRLDRLFLKLYEEERELPVNIFLDATESMAFGSPLSKFEFARKVAAAFGYVALCGFDRVRVEVFPPVREGGRELSRSELAARQALRLVRGKKSGRSYFQHLSEITSGGAAEFNQSLRRAALESGQPGVALVLSDFLDPSGYEEGLTALVRRGFQVVAVQILSREEVNPGVYGDLKLIDAESDSIQEVSFGRYRLAAYQRSVQSFCQRLKEYCRGRGIQFLMEVSDQSLETLLLKHMRQSEIWR